MDPVTSRRAAQAPNRSPEPPARPRTVGLLERLLPDAWTRSLVSPGGFTEHLRDALASNRERREYYARMSNGASRALSDHVIRLETLTLPFALHFDLRADRFNRQGIAIVDGDLVPMSGVLPADTPPRHRSVAGKADLEKLDGWLDTYRAAVSGALAHRDFETIGRLTYDLLDRVEALEKTADAHFAMTRHVVESVGYAAQHSLAYREASKGQTDDLAARFIRLQAFGLTGTIAIDRRAQALHKRGLGIIVNDLPDIPFRREWQARFGG